MNNLVQGIAALFSLAAIPVLNLKIVTPVIEYYYNPVFDQVEISSASLIGGVPTFSGTFRKIRAEECIWTGLVGLVGTQQAWTRTRMERLDQPLDQPTNRPAGTQYWGPWLFPDAENLSGADRIRVRTVHRCDLSGVREMTLDPVTGEETFVSFERVETLFFDAPYPGRKKVLNMQ